MIQPVTSRGVCVAALGGARTGAPGLQQPAHGSLGATVSAGAEFMGESGGVDGTFLPPLREIVEVGVEFPTPPGDLGEQFLGGSGIYGAADGCAVQVQRRADRRGVDTSLVQGMDLSMPLPGQLRSASLGDSGRCSRLGGGWGRLGDSIGRGLVPQAFPVSAHDLVHGVGQVVEQVLAVRHLDRVGCAAPGSVGVAAGAVAADHLAT
jgi:hypothetical protein